MERSRIARRNRNSDPTGRLDILAYRLLERQASRNPLSLALWQSGGRELVMTLTGLLPARNVLPSGVIRTFQEQRRRLEGRPV